MCSGIMYHHFVPSPALYESFKCYACTPRTRQQHQHTHIETLAFMLPTAFETQHAAAWSFGRLQPTLLFDWSQLSFSAVVTNCCPQVHACSSISSNSSKQATTPTILAALILVSYHITIKNTVVTVSQSVRPCVYTRAGTIHSSTRNIQQHQLPHFIA